MSPSQKKSNRRRDAGRWVWIALAGILFVGLVLRVSYLREIVAEPDLATPIADAAFHDYWARGLAFADWTPPNGESDPRLREVPFLHPPGYPYFLSAVYRATGAELFASRLVQMLLGLVNCFLAFLLGRALFGRAVGLVTAALCAVYWALIYFEGELQAPVLIQTVSLSALLVLDRWSRSPAVRWAVAGGLLVGTLALVRANALLFLPVASAWMIWVGRRRSLARAGAGHAAAFLAVSVLAILPATLRNVTAAGEFVLVSANGAVNLYIGNNETSDGVSAKIPDLEELTGLGGWNWFAYDRIVQGIGRHEKNPEMTYSDVSAFFTKRATDWVFGNPRDFLRLTGRRALLFWGPDEISNNEAIRFEKRNSPILKLGPGFPFVLAGALIGLFLILGGRGREGTPGVSSRGGIVLVGLFIVTYFVSFLPFLAAARFRVPLLPLLFLFFAYGITRVTDWARGGAWVRTLAAVGAGVGMFFLVGFSSFESEIDEAWWHTDRGNAFARAGKPAAALEEFEAALRASPGYVDAHVHLAQALVELELFEPAIPHIEQVLKSRPYRNDLRMQLGEIYLRLGRFDDASGIMQMAAKVDSHVPEAHFQLGRALTDAGQTEEGIEAMRKSLELQPDQPEAHANIGIALAAQGRYPEAIEEYRIALELDPFSGQTHYNLGRALESTGSLAEAEAAYREAVRVDSEIVEALIHLGNACNQTHRYEEALGWYEKALAIDERHMTARHNMSGALGNLGRLDEAIVLLEESLEMQPTHGPSRSRLKILQDARDGQSPGPR